MYKILIMIQISKSDSTPICYQRKDQKPISVRILVQREERTPKGRTSPSTTGSRFGHQELSWKERKLMRIKRA